MLFVEGISIEMAAGLMSGVVEAMKICGSPTR